MNISRGALKKNTHQWNTLKQEDATVIFHLYKTAKGVFKELVTGVSNKDRVKEEFGGLRRARCKHKSL